MNNTIRTNLKKNNTNKDKSIRHKIKTEKKTAKEKASPENHPENNKKTAKVKPHFSWDCISFLALGGLSLIGGVVCFIIALCSR